LAVERDILVYIEGNFPKFLALLRNLDPESQSVLLSYYLLSVPQLILGIIHRNTQTVISQRLRLSIKAFCAYLMGITSQEKMKAILEREHLEGSLNRLLLSQAIAEYAACRSFRKVAKRHNIHRPDIRRSMSRASQALLKNSKPDCQALGAYIFSLIDKANPRGTGRTKRKMAQCGDVYHKDPSLLGKFVVDINDKNIDALFVSRAVR
jgi:hypothetical protein